MVVCNEFAPGYSRNEQDWIEFGRDDKRRRELFHPDSMKHMAKANINMVEAVYRYVSKPDDVIMDIMAGTGTLMLAATEGRQVLLIELQPDFQDIIALNIDKLRQIKLPDNGGALPPQTPPIWFNNHAAR